MCVCARAAVCMCIHGAPVGVCVYAHIGVHVCAWVCAMCMYVWVCGEFNGKHSAFT